MKVGAADIVADALKEIEEVEKVLIVTGPYDVVALAGLPSRSQYKPFINKVHEIEGIIRTETCLAL